MEASLLLKEAGTCVSSSDQEVQVLAFSSSSQLKILAKSVLPLGLRNMTLRGKSWDKVLALEYIMHRVLGTTVF